jgi:hypothetical protein
MIGAQRCWRDTLGLLMTTSFQSSGIPTGTMVSGALAILLGRRRYEMPVCLRQPVRKAEALVREGLSEFLARRYARDQTNGLGIDELHYALPHCIYYAGIQSLIKRTLIADAVMSGWRYLILDGRKPVFTVRLSFGRHRKLEFGHVSTAFFASATIKALQRAEKLPQLKKSNFELRQLEIPGLGVVALWFHGKRSEQFMPIPTGSRKLKPYKLYTQRALTKALRQMAIRRVEIKDARA